MGIFDASMSNGGSVNSASSWMQTNAADARAWSEQQAAVAFERQKELQTMAQNFNAVEAQKARDFNSAEAMKAAEWNAAQAAAQRQWQTDMANTIYTRSVKNMREAGINPILAANMGLSGANVGSGATASMSPASGSGASIGAGSAPLAQNFMDTSSASESSGQSWNHSESGLATALAAMGSMISAALGAINAGNTLEIVMDQGKKLIGDNGIKDIVDIAKGDKSIKDLFKEPPKGSKIYKEDGRTMLDLSEAFGGSLVRDFNPLFPFLGK